MPTYAKRPEYETPPEGGPFLAVCADFIGPWTEERKAEYGGGLVDKIEYVWLLIDEINPKTNKPFRVSRRYTLSVNEKSTLYAHNKAWRGRAFTDDVYEFDMESNVGEMAQLTIVHNDTPKGTFANVDAVMAAPKGAPKLPIPTWFVRKKDRERVPTTVGATRGRQPGEDEDDPFDGAMG